MNQENTAVFSNPNQAVYHYLHFCDEKEPAAPLVGFESRSPFATVSVGDYVDPSAWKFGLEGHGLTVTKVAHKVWQEHDFLCHQVTVFCRVERGAEPVVA